MEKLLNHLAIQTYTYLYTYLLYLQTHRSNIQTHAFSQPSTKLISFPSLKSISIRCAPTQLPNQTCRHNTQHNQSIYVWIKWWAIMQSSEDTFISTQTTFKWNLTIISSFFHTSCHFGADPSAAGTGWWTGRVGWGEEVDGDGSSLLLLLALFVYHPEKRTAATNND